MSDLEPLRYWPKPLPEVELRASSPRSRYPWVAWALVLLAGAGFVLAMLAEGAR